MADQTAYAKNLRKATRQLEVEGFALWPTPPLKQETSPTSPTLPLSYGPSSNTTSTAGPSKAAATASASNTAIVSGPSNTTAAVNRFDLKLFPRDCRPRQHPSRRTKYRTTLKNQSSTFLRTRGSRRGLGESNILIGVTLLYPLPSDYPAKESTPPTISWYSISRETTLVKLMCNFAQAENIDPQELFFYFGINQVHPNSTPETVCYFIFLSS